MYQPRVVVKPTDLVECVWGCLIGCSGFMIDETFYNKLENVLGRMEFLCLFRFRFRLIEATKTRSRDTFSVSIWRRMTSVFLRHASL